jgi:DNA-binding cell septation regulator SpoVG
MNKIEISEIQIIPVKPKNGLVAFTSCVINNGIYLGNIAIYTAPSSPYGYRLVYPLKVLPNGKTLNCAYPINRITGDLIQKSVIEKYEELIEKVVMTDEKNNPSR